MITLTYAALSDDDLIESARYLPVGQISKKHIQERVLKVLRAGADVVVLHRPDVKIVLKHSYEGLSWR